jgi:hypothetical protein
VPAVPVSDFDFFLSRRGAVAHIALPRGHWASSAQHLAKQARRAVSVLP